MNDTTYISACEVRKKYKISSNTLRMWAEQGKLKCVRPGNTKRPKRLYCSEDINRIFGAYKEPGRTILYARVSSYKQKEDLKRQEEILKKAYPEGELLSDIGSGLNWKRKNFNTLLESVLKGGIEKIVVSYKDRLCRFGFELFESICKLNGAEILVLSQSSNQEEDTTELQEDLLAIITFFTARHHGKRSHINKKERTKIDNQRVLSEVHKGTETEI